MLPRITIYSIAPASLTWNKHLNISQPAFHIFILGNSQIECQCFRPTPGSNVNTSFASISLPSDGLRFPNLFDVGHAGGRDWLSWALCLPLLEEFCWALHYLGRWKCIDNRRELLELPYWCLQTQSLMQTLLQKCSVLDARRWGWRFRLPRTDSGTRKLGTVLPTLS